VAWKSANENPLKVNLKNANLVLKELLSCGTLFGVSAFEKMFERRALRAVLASTGIVRWRS
jgi:hypothetical protein